MTAGGLQNLAEVSEVAPMRPTERGFARGLQQDHFMVYSSAIQVQLNIKPGTLGFPPF